MYEDDGWTLIIYSHTQWLCYLILLFFFTAYLFDDKCGWEIGLIILGRQYFVVARCSTEEGGNELVMASSVDYQQDRRVFSGPSDEWCGFEMPGLISVNAMMTIYYCLAVIFVVLLLTTNIINQSPDGSTI